MIVDSHCHLLHKKSDLSIDNILLNAKNANVNTLLNISTTPNEFEDLIKISEKYDNVYSSIGIHPHDSSILTDDIFLKIINLVNHDKVIGIGETGLDFFYNHSNKKDQILSFNKHIDLAQDSGLPLIVHMRDSEDEISKILIERYKRKKFSGVIHCFTGSSSFLDTLEAIDFYASISGIITFSNSDSLRNTVKNIPLKRILVETDAPYLTPVPLRGKVNQSSYITHTLEYMTNLFNVSYEDLSKKTTDNFFKLFKKAIRLG